MSEQTAKRPPAQATDMLIACEKLCERLRIGYGKRVLDIGGVTGHSGLFAGLGAARRGADVTATHLHQPKLDQAKVRADLDGLNSIEFVQCDAAAMPFPDASFDFVVSTLGINFLPDQPAAAKELARVVKPGGQIGLMVFTPASVPSLVYDLVGSLFPRPPQPYHHYDWADGPRTNELLSPYFDGVAIHVDSYDSCGPSMTAVFERFVNGNPNVQAILADAAPETLDRLRTGYVEILTPRNRALDGTYMGPIEYALVTGVRRA